MSSATSTRKVTYIWLTLLVLSTISAYIGEFGKMNSMIVGFIVIALIVKGQLIVDYFMDLKHVNIAWRLVLSGFCFTLGIIIFFTYSIATASK